MKKLTNEIDNIIITRANKIINIWLLKSATNRHKIESIDIADTSSNPEEKVNKRNFSVKKCDQCDYPRPAGAKHKHFIKRTIEEDNKTLSSPKYLPIQSVVSKIDKIAEYNSETAKLKRIVDAPGKSIQQLNCYRMSYGDLNYLGSNKAIFYFDRGIRGKQIFNNSMYPLKQQPKYKDIVVIDDIVFTSPWKSDSSNQHKKRFHYRVTCAIGLTCPARLNKIEKILYARDRNTPSENFTTARSMLVRYS